MNRVILLEVAVQGSKINFRFFALRKGHLICMSLFILHIG